MVRRNKIASLVGIVAVATAFVTGCSKDKPAPAQTTVASAAPEKNTAPVAPASKDDKPGTATVKGVVEFTGKAPEMKVPKKRKDSAFCKTKEVKYNAVLVNDGKLADTFVRLANNSVKGEYKAPSEHGVIEQVDCMYNPRIQGLMVGQEIDIKNADDTQHNVHAFKGLETWFNQAQPKGSIVLSKRIEDTQTLMFTSEKHAWMRGFVVVSSHPFFAVSGKDGSFAIEKVPNGKYEVQAWHTLYGMKKATVEVIDGKAVADVNFSYDGTEEAPYENKDELKHLF
jgi:plastocyanin